MTRTRGQAKGQGNQVAHTHTHTHESEPPRRSASPWAGKYGGRGGECTWKTQERKSRNNEQRTTRVSGGRSTESTQSGEGGGVGRRRETGPHTHPQTQTQRVAALLRATRSEEVSKLEAVGQANTAVCQGRRHTPTHTQTHSKEERKTNTQRKRKREQRRSSQFVTAPKSAQQPRKKWERGKGAGEAPSPCHATSRARMLRRGVR